jgi:hypothetical protein
MKLLLFTGMIFGSAHQQKLNTADFPLAQKKMDFVCVECGLGPVKDQRTITHLALM